MTAPPVEAPTAELKLLTSLALADLAAEWVSGTAEQVRDALIGTLPALADLYGSAAAALGADWYDESRAVSGARGRFRAVVADLPTVERFESLAGWGTGPLFQAEPDVEAARAQVSGGLQRVIADAHRDTVIGSLARDPEAAGWRRKTVGDTCGFCTMIAGRGAVYSARTALFSAHDDCDCVAVPTWGEQVKVLPYVPSQKFRTPEQRAANNARLRQHLGQGVATSPRTRTVEPEPQRDRDADRTVEQLRATLASLERSLAMFDSPGTRRRAEELRRKIAART